MVVSDMPAAATQSLREDRSAWQVVRTGIWCMVVGVVAVALCSAVGLLTPPLLGEYLPQWLTDLVAILCAIGIAGGVIFLFVGLAHCLVTPHAASRVLVLTGLLLAVYSAHLWVLRFTSTLGIGSSSRGPDLERLGRTLGEQLAYGRMVTAVFSFAATILVGAAFLSMAAFFGDKRGVRRVQTLWVVQFVGTILQVISWYLPAYLASVFDWRGGFAAIIPLALSILVSLVMMFFQLRVVLGAGSRIDDGLRATAVRPNASTSVPAADAASAVPPPRSS